MNDIKIGITDIVIILIYIVGILAVGLYYDRKNKLFHMMSYPMRSHGIYERENTTLHL